jgi:hypothetical protein
MLQNFLKDLKEFYRTACFHNVNNCLNTNIYSYLQISGGQSPNLYLNVVHFFNTSVRHQWQHNTVVFLHWCLIHAVLLNVQSHLKGNEIKTLNVTQKKMLNEK